MVDEFKFKDLINPNIEYTAHRISRVEWSNVWAALQEDLSMPSKEVMHKFKSGKLHSGSKAGPKAKDRKQAIAIMMSEKRAEKRAEKKGKKP